MCGGHPGEAKGILNERRGRSRSCGSCGSAVREPTGGKGTGSDEAGSTDKGA